MRTPLFLASTIATLFLAADKDASGGGGDGKPAITGGTLKEKLESATGLIGQLDSEKEQLASDLKDSNEKITKLDGEKAKLAQDLKTANEKITALTGEKEQLGKDLTAANEKITRLEGEAKDTDTKAGERAAANGLPPVQTEAGKNEAKGKDGAALYAEYQTLKGREKTAFFREHEKALMAYAKQLEKEGQ